MRTVAKARETAWCVWKTVNSSELLTWGDEAGAVEDLMWLLKRLGL